MKYIVMTSTDEDMVEYDYFDNLDDAAYHTVKFLRDNQKHLNKIINFYEGAYIFSVKDDIFEKFEKDDDSEIILENYAVEDYFSLKDLLENFNEEFKEVERVEDEWECHIKYMHKNTPIYITFEILKDDEEPVDDENINWQINGDLRTLNFKIDF